MTMDTMMMGMVQDMMNANGTMIHDDGHGPNDGRNAWNGTNGYGSYDGYANGWIYGPYAMGLLEMIHDDGRYGPYDDGRYGSMMMGTILA